MHDRVPSDSSHAITQDVSLAETARAAEFFMADGIVITGTATGRPAEPDHVTGRFFKYFTQEIV